ncbi:MAG: hypothetical protein ABR509_00255 [Candidatus Limnocylindria bacterium]
MTGEVKEPCRRCGEETAVGSVFFSARRRIELSDGTAAYLCGVCDARIATPSGQRWTDDEVRRAVEGGSLATISIARER